MEYQKFLNFKYWFLYESADVYTVIDLQSNKEYAKISDSGIITLTGSQLETSIFDLEHDIIENNFKEFKKRPEYGVGKRIKLDGVSSELAKQAYVNLMVGLIMIRARKAGQDPDAHQKYIDRILNWLESTDFYICPASTIYHEAFKHGLLYHTLSVYNNMVDLYQIPKFAGKVDIDSATLCCLVHDWCKINLYESYKRNVKNEETGRWEQKDSYRRGSFPYAFGHGVSSMFMAMNMFKLTEEEALGIRWHMSMFNVSSNEVNEYQQACEMFPMVHLIQFADQLSITSY